VARLLCPTSARHECVARRRSDLRSSAQDGEYRTVTVRLPLIRSFVSLRLYFVFMCRGALVRLPLMRNFVSLSLYFVSMCRGPMTRLP